MCVCVCVCVCVCLHAHARMLFHIRLFATLWTVAHQAPLSMRFSRQECWSGLPYPSPGEVFPTQGWNPHLLAGGFFATSATYGNGIKYIITKTIKYLSGNQEPQDNKTMASWLLCITFKILTIWEHIASLVILQTLWIWTWCSRIG